jgi:hypothetical protein
MELRRATREQIAGPRAAKQQKSDMPIVPGFYARLVEDAEPFLLFDTAPEDPLGYVLLLAREHEGHAHTTLVELGLGERHQDRYEDVLDHIRDKAKATVYLVRTDDCRLSATLLARGLQVEATALIWRLRRGLEAGRPQARPKACRSADDTGSLEFVGLTPSW